MPNLQCKQWPGHMVTMLGSHGVWIARLVKLTNRWGSTPNAITPEVRTDGGKILNPGSAMET